MNELPPGPAAPEGASPERPPPVPPHTAPPEAPSPSLPRADGQWGAALAPPREENSGPRLNRTDRNRGPWGFWATLGFSAAIAAIVLALSVGLVIAALVAGDVLGIGALRGDRLEETLQSGFAQSLMYNVLGVAVVPLTLLAAWLRRGYPLKAYLGLRLPTWQQAAFWVLVVAVFAEAADVATHYLLKKPVVPPSQAEMYQTAVSLPLFFWTLVIAAPALEETFFRGFMLEGFSRSKIGPVAAVLVTSGLWAATHIQYDWSGVLTIFLMGILLGAARLKTGSLWLVMLLHGVNNLMAGIQTALAAHGWAGG